MPLAVTHILVALFVADLIRLYVINDKKRFPLYMVLIAGIAGLVPDIDVVVYWILNTFTSIPLASVHHVATHNIFIPLVVLVVALIIRAWNEKWFFILSMISLGLGTHLVLDSLFGSIPLLTPFYFEDIGLRLIPSGELGISILQGMDAILLVLWLLWEYYHKNIRDYF